MPNNNSFILPYWIPEIGQRITVFLARPFCRIFLRKRIVGLENLRGLKPGIIFAMNHLSEWDPFLFADTFGLFSKMLPVYFISLENRYYREHKTVRSWFYGGNFFRFMGAFPALLGIKDYEESLSFHIKMLRKGKNILIFPEGGRSKDGKLQPGKGGVVALAKATNAPIVPVGLSGVFHVSVREFFLRKRRAIVSVGKPIFPEEVFDEGNDLSYSDYPAIANEKIMPKIGERVNFK